MTQAQHNTPATIALQPPAHHSITRLALTAACCQQTRVSRAVQRPPECQTPGGARETGRRVPSTPPPSAAPQTRAPQRQATKRGRWDAAGTAWAACRMNRASCSEGLQGRRNGQEPPDGADDTWTAVLCEPNTCPTNKHSPAPRLTGSPWPCRGWCCPSQSAPGPAAAAGVEGGHPASGTLWWQDVHQMRLPACLLMHARESTRCTSRL